jgi:hypothetical protein
MDADFLIQLCLSMIGEISPSFLRAKADAFPHARIFSCTVCALWFACRLQHARDVPGLRRPGYDAGLGFAGGR